MWDFIMKYWLEVLFGAIVAGLSWAYGMLAKKFKKEKAKNLAIESGLRELMRIQILDVYEQCVQNGRKITVSKKDAVDSLFKSYVALGGDNGTTIHIHTQMMEMDII